MIGYFEVALRLLMASCFGAAVGFEREQRERPAGLRTNMMVSLGAALITIVSLNGFAGSDPARVAAGIVTGIGFLGAGTIFKIKDQVVGLTTAATLWTVAALGMTIGAGFYVTAIIALPIIVGILYLSKFELRKKSE